MTDKEFLSWVADRLVHVYGESENVDFVHKLRKISQRTWVGLESEEIRKAKHHIVDGAYHYSFKQGAEWAEAKLKEKNGG